MCFLNRSKNAVCKCYVPKRFLHGTGQTYPCWITALPVPCNSVHYYPYKESLASTLQNFWTVPAESLIGQNPAESQFCQYPAASLWPVPYRISVWLSHMLSKHIILSIENSAGHRSNADCVGPIYILNEASVDQEKFQNKLRSVLNLGIKFHRSQTIAALSTRPQLW